MLVLFEHRIGNRMLGMSHTAAQSLVLPTLPRSSRVDDDDGDAEQVLEMPSTNLQPFWWVPRVRKRRTGDTLVRVV